MQYAVSLPFRRDVDRAFRLAESVLTAIGFRITERSEFVMDLVGPGMNSNRESALLGASRIRISGGNGELSLEADLGGVARLSRFVTLFPIGLCLSLAIGLSALFAAVNGPGDWLLGVMGATGGIACLWFVLGPVVVRGLRTRTERALDTLLANMAAVGESE